MNRAPVTSSNVVSVGYDVATRTLEVEYGSGLYQYDGVPPRKYAELDEAESVGKYLAANIKGVYPHRKIEIDKESSTAPHPPLKREACPSPRSGAEQ